jgi:signal peptidase II
VSDQQSTSERGPEPSPSATPLAVAPRRLRLCLVVAAAALGLDIVSKLIIVATLSDRAPLRLLGGALYLTEARNPGAAWGLGAGTAAATVLFTGVAAVVVVVIVRAARRLHSIGWAVAFGLVLGGALGNLTDRLLRDPGIGRGHVVDWISVFAGDGSVFPIFNAADSAITCGAALAVLMAVRGVEFDGRRTKDVEAQKASDAVAPSAGSTAAKLVPDPAPAKGAAPSADESAEACA